MGNIGETIAPGILIPDEEPFYMPDDLPAAPVPQEAPVKEPVPV